jgi:hypothetical protein
MSDLENPPIKYEPLQINGVFSDNPINSSTGVYCHCKKDGKFVIYNGRAALAAHFKTKCHQKWLHELNQEPSEEPTCKLCDEKNIEIRDLKIQLTILQNKMVDYSLKEKFIKELSNNVTELKTELKMKALTISVLQQHLLKYSTQLEEKEGEEGEEEDDQDNLSESNDTIEIVID